MPSLATDPSPQPAGFCGIWGLPYVDLAPLFDTTPLARIDEEICLGLTRVATSYTGGSLKWMNVVAPQVQEDGYVDSMNVIEGFSREEFAAFVSLADTPGDFDLDRWRDYTFGDETDHPLNTRADALPEVPLRRVLPLEGRLPPARERLVGGQAPRRRQELPPRGARGLPAHTGLHRGLPFREIGRVVLFGLEANDHAPLHRDTEPGSRDEVQHSITICPRANKRFYLSDPGITRRLHVPTPLYWFNDMD